ncbi:DNA-processing protein DprA [Nocardia sp. NPDC003482]
MTQEGSALRRRAWAVLSRAAVEDEHRVHRLLADHDPVDAAHVITSSVPGSSVQARRDLAFMAECGGRLVTRDDDEWPVALRRLPGAGALEPVALWVRGTARLDLFTQYRVAVTGARAASDYGVLVANDLAGGLAARGWTIVAGGGFGIDAAAHQTGIRAGTATFAVLPCGVDRVFPYQHAELFARIADTGLLVSEYPPGVAPTPGRSGARHRLIAALGVGVVVCEAGVRSGTDSIVRCAHRLGLPVAAVPGSIYSPASVGCHRFLREGRAQLVTTVTEVLDLLVGRDDAAGPP